MACLAPKCSIKKDGERQVVCSICKGLYHIKCVGLLARTTDQLVDSEMGLRWSCVKCRKVDIEFYEFCYNNSAEFAELNNDLDSLKVKFKRFEERFNKFDNLNKFISENSSPKRKKPVETVLAAQVEVSVPTILLNEPMEQQGILTPSDNRAGISAPIMMAPPHTRSRNPSSSNLIELDPKSPVIQAAPLDNMASVNIGASSAPTSTRSLVIQTTPLNNLSSGSTFGPIVQIAGSASQTQSTPSLLSISASSSSTAPRPLTVVKARKTVFISRLGLDTAVVDVLSYITMKFDVELDIQCFKINAKGTRSMSSFKVIVSDEIFRIIIDAGFWPPGVLVREFVPRENRELRRNFLPNHVRNKPTGNASKN